MSPLPLKLPPDGSAVGNMLHSAVAVLFVELLPQLEPAHLPCLCAPRWGAHVCFMARAVAEKVRAHAAVALPPLAAAVGPQHAPSLPASNPAAERAAAALPLMADNRTVVSAGDWTGRAKRLAVRCGAPSVGPPGLGRCPNPCDQLYDSCLFPVPHRLAARACATARWPSGLRSSAEAASGAHPCYGDGCHEEGAPQNADSSQSNGGRHCGYDKLHCLCGLCGFFRGARLRGHGHQQRHR